MPPPYGRLPMTTIDTLTDDQIAALSTEAAAAGDLAMVAVCARALAGDDTARTEVVRIIRDAEAQE